MNDIITTMFNKKFLEELFKPQELYSKKALRTVFDRLAHASIMRLNQASMDKVSHHAYTQNLHVCIIYFYFYICINREKPIKWQTEFLYVFLNQSINASYSPNKN